jgi:small subunit ribosomal protein S17
VHDPNNSLRLGDVVAITPGWRVSKTKRHVVKHIVAPGSGVPIDGRAPVPTAEELCAEREALRAVKTERRTLNKVAEKVEKRMGVAEAILRRARKEFALRARLMGASVPEGSQAARKAAGAQP